MEAKDLNRSISQYQELYNLDKDEFLYSIIYELAIRAACNDIEELMNLLEITPLKDGLCVIVAIPNM